MKKRKIACSKCNGKGSVEEYIPHHSVPEIVVCPQCKGMGEIYVVVPEEKDKLDE